jgi:integrase
MPGAFLTEISIAKLPIPRDGQCDWWDTNLKCFGVRCSRGGTKTYVLKHKNRRYTLGRVGVVPLKRARDEARRRLALKYFPEPVHMSAAAAIEQYIKARARELKRSSIYQIRHHLQDHFPGHLDLQRITARHVHEHLDRLPPSAASHAYAAFKTFFAWCVRRQYLVADPLHASKMPHTPRSRDRVLSDPELKQLWEATEAPTAFERIVRLLLLTGQRRSQITHIEIGWIADDAILFPASIMKSGHRHTIPLTAQMRLLLAPGHHSRLIFPATSSLPFNNLSDAMTSLRQRMPNAPHFVLHDLRRTFSTKLSEWEICPLDVTEAILDHQAGSRSAIQRTYDRHSRLPQMRRALEAFQERLMQVVGQPAGSAADTSVTKLGITELAHRVA